jgi:hypothetical protein
VALDGVLAGEVKLALQVLLSDFEIEQGHVDIFVSQQLHEGRQADAQAQHFCGEGMSKAMRDHTLRASGPLARMDGGVAE